MINEYTIGAAVLIGAYVLWKGYRWAQSRAEKNN